MSFLIMTNAFSASRAPIAGRRYVTTFPPASRQIRTRFRDKRVSCVTVTCHRTSDDRETGAKKGGEPRPAALQDSVRRSLLLAAAEAQHVADAPDVGAAAIVELHAGVLGAHAVLAALEEILAATAEVPALVAGRGVEPAQRAFDLAGA